LSQDVIHASLQIHKGTIHSKRKVKRDTLDLSDPVRQPSNPLGGDSTMVAAITFPI